MKNTALYNKMKMHGLGYRFCATCINVKYGSDIHFTDVYNFIHGNYQRIGRERKRIIRKFFYSKKWLHKPAPRKAPQCRRCGLKYPTRKFVNTNRSRNHKRTTKLSHQ